MYSAVLEKPRVLKIRTKRIPRIRKGDILVRVAACAVCGTDVKKYFLGHRLIKSYPIVPGHEIAGEIVKVGKIAESVKVEIEGKKEIRRYRIGQKVVVAPVVACDKCVNCMEGRYESCEYREDIGFNFNGGFEEYILIPKEILRRRINPIISIPENLPLYMAAISEPFACALHAHKKLVRPGRWDKNQKKYQIISGIVEGDAVVVIGGGALGCMHAELAKSSGADVVVIAQHSERRLNMIKHLDVADYYVLNKTTEDLEDEILHITDGLGADIVITATSSSIAQIQALKIVRKGGVVSFFGGVNKDLVRLPTNKIHYNGPFITGTSGASPFHISIILKLMAEQRIDPTRYITHILSLNDLEKLLLIKGVPSLISMKKILSTYGDTYLSFLEKEDSLQKQSLEEKVLTFKESILKALVIPTYSRTIGIESLMNLSLGERREKLINLVF